MVGYTFRTYISEGKEYFLFGEQEISGDAEIKKDFPFPESLMAFLDLDIWALEPLFKKMDRALLSLYSSRDEAWAVEVQSVLDALAPVHIYFQFLRLDWTHRLEQAQRQKYETVQDLLPHKEISHIPSNIDTMQKQIRNLFAAVLDIDGISEKRSVSKRMAAYYRAHGEDTLHTFQFQPLPLCFEAIDEETFTEVLYPKTIYDLADYALRECVRREVRMRVCKNCGRWFAILGRSSAEYCDRVIDNKGRTCKDVGSIAQWTRKRSSDEIFKIYRREYKKRFAWIKAGRVTQEEFYTWSEQARREKQRCDDGEITLEEFSDWLIRS